MTEWQVKYGNDLLSSIIFLVLLFHTVKNLKMWYTNFVALIQPNAIHTLL